jgi:F-type H+-transporting ATPase subunit b
MNGWKDPLTRPTLVLVTAAFTFWNPLQALAADPGGNWRPIYDTVMMWVNFIILVALLIKFLRQPLRNFLNKERDAVKETLDRLGAEKSRIEEDIQSLRDTLEDRKQKAADMHRRIVAQGQDERREIIETARQEAERRLLKAHQLIEARHREACQVLRNEMVDTAIHLAMQEFAKHMTPDIEQTLTDRFLKTVADRQA